MTPMHEAANVLREVMCHLVERKHASTVYQFQNICDRWVSRVHGLEKDRLGVLRTEDLQFPDPPMSIPGMLMLGAVVVGIPVVLVAEAVATEVVIISIAIVVVFVAE